jgi:hypothetical protein
LLGGSVTDHYDQVRAEVDAEIERNGGGSLPARHPEEP